MMNFRLIDAAKVQQFFESANFFKIFLSTPIPQVIFSTSLINRINL
jgi:hypothetical protein